MPPKISLLMAAWNRAKYIRAAIGSALAQTFRDFELIVWDDGSSDDTLAVARLAAEDDPRVRIVSGSHQGQGPSLVAAAAMATGDYLGWMDSDDAIAPTCLADCAAVLDAHPNVGMVYSGYVHMNADGRVTGRGTRTDIPYSPNRLLTDFMTFQFRLMRRGIYDQVGGLDLSFPCAFDYDFCLKVSEITDIRFLDKPLYFYRWHEQMVSHTKRLDQIMASQRAIANALKRRGMDQEYEIDVELIGRYRLRRIAESGTTDEQR